MRAFRGYECDYVFSCYLLGYDFPIAVLVRTNMLNNILFLKSFCSPLSGVLCSPLLRAPRLEAFTEASLWAMSAIILPAASWQGIVMRKNVRSSSVTTVARGDPLFSNTFCMVGIPVERPSVMSSSLRYSPKRRLR